MLKNVSHAAQQDQIDALYNQLANSENETVQTATLAQLHAIATEAVTGSAYQRQLRSRHQALVERILPARAS